MKILILGGSGILSTAVCREAISRGYSVSCITRGNRDFAIPEGAQIVHGNVYQLEEIIDLLEPNYDAVLDFLSFEEKQLRYKVDVLKDLTKQYIFVSSATAYRIVDSEITEETPLGNQYWDYGANKVKCEKFLTKYAAEYNLNYTIIRPYVTYGETRIPFAIIPDGEYWTLANRILCNKPVLLWDNGEATCTLTHTSDFAKAFIDIVGNPMSYGQAFHITSSERLKWKEVLGYISNALGMDMNYFSAESNKIVEYLPQYKGVLFGDKAQNRIFDNSKIRNIAPSFKNFLPFSVGISRTVEYFMANQNERRINYMWDGRVDNAIYKMSKENEETVPNLHFASSEKKISFKARIKYAIGRYDSLYFLYGIAKNPRKITSILKKKKSDFSFKEKQEFHKFGVNCIVKAVDFGKDKKMISIGNNVYLADGVKFVNYHATAEFFDRCIGDGTNAELRDLGPINIKDNVYLSSGVTILPNVTIGENSLVLENSVVVENVPANSVACGNPATVVGSIFDWYEKLMKKNKEYPWYNMGYDHERIVMERELFFFED